MNSERITTERKVLEYDLIGLGVNPYPLRNYDTQHYIYSLRKVKHEIADLSDDEMEMEYNIEESITNIINRLEEENDQKTNDLMIKIESEIDITEYEDIQGTAPQLEDKPTEMEKFTEVIFEEILAKIKSNSLETDNLMFDLKIDNELTDDKILGENFNSHEKEISGPPKVLEPREISLWNEIEPENDPQWFVPYVTQFSIKLDRLPSFMTDMYDSVPLKSFGISSHKRKANDQSTSVKNSSKKSKKAKKDRSKNEEIKKIHEKFEKAKSKSSKNRIKKKHKSDFWTETKAFPDNSSKETSIPKIKVSEKKSQRTFLDKSRNNSKTTKLVIKQEIFSKNSKKFEIEKYEVVPKPYRSLSNENCLKKKPSSKTNMDSKRAKLELAKVGGKIVKSEIAPARDYFSFNYDPSLDYEEFSPDLGKNSFSSSRDDIRSYIIISKKPLVKNKSIMTHTNKKRTSQNKSVSFCSSIFIRRFVPEDDDDSEVS